ncbi:MAG: MATE family efflux transporter [Negativicutes bacterium]|nr:MATE family efflux transporter [Negativicutes bacterium]
MHVFNLARPQPGEPTQKQLRRNIFRMIWPVTIDSVLQMTVGMVATAMVGRLGATAIGAVGLSSRLTQISWALFAGIATGVTVLVARCVGAKQIEEARKIAYQGLISALILIAGMTAVSFVFAEPFLRSMNVDGELLAACLQYLSIALFTLPLIAVIQISGGIMRGMGDTKIPMLVSLAVNLVNVGGCWLLIYGNLGFPALGIRGAAIASLFGQGIGAILALTVIFLPISKLQLKKEDIGPLNFKEIKRIMRIGIPSSAGDLFWQMASIVMTGLIVTFGTVPLAAHNLGMQAEGISYMPSIGLTIAATAFVGQSLGAKNLNLTKRYIQEIFLWALLFCSFASLLLIFGGRFLLSLLTDDQEVITLGAKYLFLMGFCQIPLDMAGVINGALKGAGDTKWVMYIQAIGMWLLRIPLSYVLGKYLGFGIMGVWWAMTIDLFVRFILVVLRYAQGKWQTMEV